MRTWAASEEAELKTVWAGVLRTDLLTDGPHLCPRAERLCAATRAAL
eukprot:COSAG06_NODE_16625_length_990_cov_0.989899_1_plen_46_part_10